LQSNPAALNTLRRFIGIVPLWAFALVLLVVVVNIIYLVNMYRMEFEDIRYRFEDGQCIISEISSRGPAKRAGLQPGDIVLSIDSITITGPEQLYHELGPYKIGDTLTYRVLRGHEELIAARVPGSYMQESPVLYYIKYLLILCFSVACMYVVYKKPRDRSVGIFFLYFQLYAITHSAYLLFRPDPIANSATVIFLFCTYLSGPALIHFILIFPRHAIIYKRFRQFPFLFYVAGFFLASFFSVYYLLAIYHPSSGFYEQLMSVNRMHSTWIGATCCIAIAIAIYQFRTIKDTIARNQLRMMIIGAFFGYSTPIAYAVFYHELLHLDFLYPFIFYDLAALVTIFIMLICFMIALLRYRIWEIELYIKKALLYLGATLLILITYLILIYLVNRWSEGTSDLTRFLSLAVSVILFLVLRDRLQKWIDRLFRRETYDSATVVSGFEEKLAGIYRPDEITTQIALQIDEIFHFKTFMLGLKKEGLFYQPVIVLGKEVPPDQEFQIDYELDNRLRKPQVFSPGELDQQPPILQKIPGELIVPLLKEGQSFGFFLCGPKQSERSYSTQDIRVLQLIAKRVIALFHTASLYQKDLDRQLMLERERARISQDMHDDVGASLTRISILSDLARRKDDVTGETKQWLSQISDTSRSVMEEMSQIVWALNPRNDTLEGLIAYIRRFANEYLEPTSIHCSFDLPASLPSTVLTVETRRNVYLVVREALHNVVKHSGAKNINIVLEMNEKALRIKIKDDGKGFDPGRLEFPGNGLVNMRKRMNDIGGEILIKSEPGSGTEIELIVSLK